MSPNYDPRDETDVRPQVGFRLKVGSYDHGEFFASLGKQFLTCHDMMLFDPTNGEVPGVVRFEWDTARTVVDRTAEWLRSQPHVLSVHPMYGGPIGAA
jgi:hypothetical protein